MNIKELKEAAESAQLLLQMVGVYPGDPDFAMQRDAREIMWDAASPSTILSLIERYEQMEEALRRIAKRAKPHDDDTDDDRKRDLFHILAIAEANVSPIAEVANADPR